MTEPLVFEADPAEFLERARRTQAHLATLKGDAGFDVDEWSRGMSAIIREVEPLPLVVGVRYRMRTLAGPIDFEHLHFQDEGGAVHGVDLPTATEVAYVEVEGRFVGRRAIPHGATQIFFDIGGGQAALLVDGDILKIEEVR